MPAKSLCAKHWNAAPNRAALTTAAVYPTVARANGERPTQHTNCSIRLIVAKAKSLSSENCSEQALSAPKAVWW